MCSHRYEYRADVNVPSDVANRCLCLHGTRPEKYPTCVCPRRGAWVCSHCGDVQRSDLMKSCAGCHTGIHSGVRYSQHFHDACVPDEMWPSYLGAR